MKFYVKVFMSKNNKKCVALVYKQASSDIYITYDKEIIMRLLDLRPSEYDGLTEGYYSID